jgi:subtilisin family serine protease
VRIKKQYTNFNTIAVQLPASVIESLNSFPEVEFVSGDDEVRSLGGHVASTSGADDVRSLGTNGPLDGNGVGIAIVDSGIYQDHVAFLKVGTTQSRIVMSVDFTGEGRTDDPYGHGTHVASAAAGNGLVANGRYIGIAPKANIINL